MIKYGELNVKRIRDVKLPTRSGLDSGYDLYIPDNINDLLFIDNCKYTPSDYISDGKQEEMKKLYFDIENNIIKIPSLFGILIPSGLKFQLPASNVGGTIDFVLANKSGIATKSGLIIGAQVIDNQYRGEMHIHVINTTPFDIFIKGGQKITQGILRTCFHKEVNEVEEIFENTDRGSGGFGSTGLN